MAGRPRRLFNEQELMDYAVRLLSGAAHSTGEIRERLLGRAAERKDVDAVLGRLKELGYLNDRRFAETWAASRLENEGHGRPRVLRDLRQRRVAPKLAEDVVRRAYANTEETTLIENFLARRFRGKDLSSWLAEEKNLAAAYRRLRYAGFASGPSIRVLKRFAASDEVLDRLESEDEIPPPDNAPTES